MNLKQQGKYLYYNHEKRLERQKPEGKNLSAGNPPDGDVQATCVGTGP